MKVYVNLKKLGKRRNSIIKTPYEWEKAPSTVRDLIATMVAVCVRDYNKRLESNEILQNLTLQDIEDKAESGKIGFGVNYGEKAMDVKDAVDNALTAFEDGIFRIFIGENEVRQLEERIGLNDGQELTFVRMTMLSGRLW